MLARPKASVWFRSLPESVDRPHPALYDPRALYDVIRRAVVAAPAKHGLGASLRNVPVAGHLALDRTRAREPSTVSRLC